MPLTSFRKILITCLLLTALAVAACDKPPTIRPLPPKATILAFGDSLTFGTGAPSDASYPAVLTDLLGTTVINAGVPGEVSADGRERLPGLLEQHRPALVILCHGGNDFLRRGDASKVKANLQAMMRCNAFKAQFRKVLLPILKDNTQRLPVLA